MNGTDSNGSSPSCTLCFVLFRIPHSEGSEIDMKSAMAGGILGTLLCLLVGAADHSGSPGAVGRFQIACTNMVCYLVDTTNGQVWQSGDRGFKSPKLQDQPVALTGESADFVGQWDSDDPSEDDLTLRIEPDGEAIATEGSRQHEGRWRVEGTRIFITIDDETVTGEIVPEGRLILWEEGNDDDRIPFL